MGSSLFEKLFAAGDALSGKFFRAVGGSNRVTGNAIGLELTERGHLITRPTDTTGDLYSRTRVSFPKALFEAKQILDNAPTLMDSGTTGGGSNTYSSATASTTMQVGTASGDQAVRQSHGAIPCQPGRATLVYATGVLGPKKANVRQRIGIFDADDGIFFEQNNTNGFSVVRRTSTSGSSVDTLVAQASFNLDKLDGTGASGLTIDPTQEQLYVIEFQWLGAGRARLGIVVNGSHVFCHVFDGGNVLTVPYFKSPLLPIRYELTNTGTAASLTQMTQTCCAAFSEGGFDSLGFAISQDSGTTGKSIASGTPVPIIVVRLKTAFQRGRIYPLSFSVNCPTSIDFIYRLVINPTLTGATFAAGNTTGAATEYDLAATALSGGTIAQVGYVSLASKASSGVAGTIAPHYFIASNLLSGVADTLALVAVPIGGAGTFFGALSWQEVY